MIVLFTVKIDMKKQLVILEEEYEVRFVIYVYYSITTLSFFVQSCILSLQITTVKITLGI